MQQGLPFSVKLPMEKPLAMGTLSKEELDAELEKGYQSYLAGNSMLLHDFEKEMKRDYGI